MDLVRLAALILVVTLPLVVAPWGEQAYSAPKALVLLFLVAIMLIGWLAGMAAGAAPSWRLTTPELALWAFVLTVILSSANSVDPRLTIFGAPGRAEGLLAIVAYITLYFFGAHFFGSARGMRTLALAAGAGAMIAIVYGFCQLVLPPLFEGERLQQEWYGGGSGFTRIFSTLGSPNVYGGFLSLLVPFMAAVGLSVPRLAGRVWLLAALLGYVSIIATMSRGAWAGALAGAVVFAMLLGRAELARRWRLFLGSLAGVIVVAVLALLTIATPRQVAARTAAAFDSDGGSLAQHLYIWERSIELVRARPLVGWGLETLRDVFPYDRDSLVSTFGLRPVIIDRAHNDLLHVAVSVGIPGALAYAVFWSAVVWTGVRVWRRTREGARVLAAGWTAGMIGYLVHLQVLFSAVAVAPLAWLLAGACAGWEVETRQR